MSTGLGWLGVGVGLAGCVATFLMSGRSPGGNGKIRLSAGLTFILTVILWAIAMRSDAPFSTGQTLGWGFLIGGMSGVAAILLSGRLESGEEAKPTAMNSILFLALFAASLTYLIFHGYPQPPLIGFAMGAAMAGILAYYSIEETSAADFIRSWALFGVLLAASIVLAVEHFDQGMQRNWWPLPILIATTVMIARFAAAQLPSIEKLKWSSAIAAPILVIILSTLYAWRVYNDWALLAVVAVGIVIGALARRLESDSSPTAPLITALLVIAFMVAAFKLWAGLGIALGLLAMWSVEMGQKRTLQGVFTLGLALLLVKLFTDSYRGALGGADLQVHYAFVGAALGVIVPFLLISALQNRRRIIAVALIGFAAAISPVVLYLIWETRAEFGFLFGLTAAIILQVLVGEEKLFGRSIGLLVIGAQLTAIQFTQSLLIVELTRAQRIWILGVVVVVGAIVLAFLPRRTVPEEA